MKGSLRVRRLRLLLLLRVAERGPELLHEAEVVPVGLPQDLPEPLPEGRRQQRHQAALLLLLPGGHLCCCCRCCSASSGRHGGRCSVLPGPEMDVFSQPHLRVEQSAVRTSGSRGRGGREVTQGGSGGGGGG